jgi:dihydrofolate reductase
VNTSTFKGTHGGGDAPQEVTDVDEQFAARAMSGLGAWIMGRNMFGPIRGRGPTNRGAAGGGRTRPITHRCSF